MQKGTPFCAGDRRGFASSPFAHAVGTAKDNFEIKRKASYAKGLCQFKNLKKIKFQIPDIRKTTLPSLG
jgi:hypothetical protein